jgi:hypothetical protein
MKVECKACDGERGHVWYDDHGMMHRTGCVVCRGTGLVDEEPEEPPPHTDADAPEGTEPTVGYCIFCDCGATDCVCEDEVDENALREALGIM